MVEAGGAERPKMAKKHQNKLQDKDIKPCPKLDKVKSHDEQVDALITGLVALAAFILITLIISLFL